MQGLLPVLAAATRQWEVPPLWRMRRKDKDTGTGTARGTVTLTFYWDWDSEGHHHTYLFFVTSFSSHCRALKHKESVKSGLAWDVWFPLYSTKVALGRTRRKQASPTLGPASACSPYPTALIWPVASPAGVPVYCPLFSNQVPVTVAWPVILLVLPTLLEVRKPAITWGINLLRIDQNVKGFTIFKREVGYQMAVATEALDALSPDAASRCGPSGLWQPSLCHTLPSPQCELLKDSSTELWAHPPWALSDSLTLEIPSKPHTLLHLFCSRLYAAHWLGYKVEENTALDLHST